MSLKLVRHLLVLRWSLYSFIFPGQEHNQLYITTWEVDGFGCVLIRQQSIYLLITFDQPELVIFVHVCTSYSWVSKCIQCNYDMAYYIYMTIKIIIIFHTFFSLKCLITYVYITFATNNVNIVIVFECGYRSPSFKSTNNITISVNTGMTLIGIYWLNRMLKG